MKALLIATLMVAVAGCSDVRNAVHPGETRMLTRDFLPPEVEQAPAPLYCYRTLAAQECHSAALEGQQNRMVGHYGTAPRTTSH